MRVWLLVLAGCAAAPAAPIGPPRMCKLSPEALKYPEDGGSRRFPTEAARRRFRDAHPNRHEESYKMFIALDAAIRDSREEYQRCLELTESYYLEIQLQAHRTVGGFVESTRVRRIVDSADGSEPVPTSAEACIAPLLAHLELPPSDGPGTLRAVLKPGSPCQP